MANLSIVVTALFEETFFAVCFDGFVQVNDGQQSEPGHRASKLLYDALLAGNGVSFLQTRTSGLQLLSDALFMMSLDLVGILREYYFGCNTAAEGAKPKLLHSFDNDTFRLFRKGPASLCIAHNPVKQSSSIQQRRNAPV